MEIWFELAEVRVTRLHQGYKCILLSSYLDVDECAIYANTCPDNKTTCQNTEGSFSCPCNSGYTRDGYNCIGEYSESTFGYLAPLEDFYVYNLNFYGGMSVDTFCSVDTLQAIFTFTYPLFKDVFGKIP